MDLVDTSTKLLALSSIDGFFVFVLWVLVLPSLLLIFFLESFMPILSSLSSSSSPHLTSFPSRTIHLAFFNGDLDGEDIAVFLVTLVVHVVDAIGDDDTNELN